MLIQNTIQQISFIVNPENHRNASMFFILEKMKEIILDFLQGTVEFLRICLLNLIKYQYKILNKTLLM